MPAPFLKSKFFLWRKCITYGAALVATWSKTLSRFMGPASRCLPHAFVHSPPKSWHWGGRRRFLSARPLGESGRTPLRFPCRRKPNKSFPPFFWHFPNELLQAPRKNSKILSPPLSYTKEKITITEIINGRGRAGGARPLPGHCKEKKRKNATKMPFIILKGSRSLRFSSSRGGRRDAGRKKREMILLGRGGRPRAQRAGKRLFEYAPPKRCQAWATKSATQRHSPGHL